MKTLKIHDRRQRKHYVMKMISSMILMIMMVSALPSIIPSGNETSNATQYILQSGAPPPRLATGVPITVDQKAATLIKTSFPASFVSAAIYLTTPLVKPNNSIILSLCNNVEFSLAPNTSSCLETSQFELPPVKRIHIEWQSTTHPKLIENQTYWLVVESNIKEFEDSFSWLDAESFNHTTSYFEDNVWKLELDRPQSSTIDFLVHVD
ncbi:hypothetical protein BC833DRAFT_608460 [Globomyces pollinis-pini]|nr:hypothetical protein BC833DRAFT_608460 [Globomyces pollinis-pini]